MVRNPGSITVFDADIEACFDGISHGWLLDNVPMDKSILRMWLQSGYMEDNAYYATEKGTPQGGIISPVLANLALDGLEECVKEAAGKPRPRPKAHMIRYADDLVATARTREMLEEQIIPAIETFLQQRGLRLSKEKSKIVHIDDGFDFLGANVRKYGGKLLMKPTKANVIAVTRDLKEYVRRSRGAAQPHLIYQVNRRLRGWANAFRHLVSSRAFRYVDRRLSGQLWRWARKRHGNKGKGWVKRRYYRRHPDGSWIFASRARDAKGRWKEATLFRAGDLRIRRHVKVRGQARVHDSTSEAYFEERRKLQRKARWRDLYRWQETTQLKLEMGA